MTVSTTISATGSATPHSQTIAGTPSASPRTAEPRGQTLTALVVVLGEDAEALDFTAAQIVNAGLTASTVEDPGLLAETVAGSGTEIDVVLCRAPLDGAGLTAALIALGAISTPRRVRTVIEIRPERPENRQMLLAAGADTVLVVPGDDGIVLRTIRVAAIDRGPPRAIGRYIGINRSAIGRLVSGIFEISTLTEAERLATLLASCHPDPERLVIGIWELLCNAIEHGNLEIDFATKRELLLTGRYEEEIERRLATQPYAARRVHVAFRRTRHQVRLRIIDAGKGFDHASAMSQGYPLDGPNGRGIAIASKLCFDRITYRGRGNIVEAISRCPDPTLNGPR
ncbi:ATP-binding protein [Methyloraptor flagellatus]|uniref:ATP-binding protein n=1 Tax=Methyloraptor flagellatus TaxID=3162530 RepID=A0AAU7XA51_9HYPH